MVAKIRLGFPRMNKEAGERRVFLPDFIQYLSRFADIYIEEGYGSRDGFDFADYRQGNPKVHMTDREGAFRKDFVMILRSPNDDEFHLLKPGSCLISMLHYPTRPKRVEILQKLGIKAISLDSIADDNDIRLVENMHAVAWNGLEAAFDTLGKKDKDLIRNNRPFMVLILGTGMVGKHAIEAATKLGNVERNNRHIQQKGPGAVALCVGRNITNQPEQLIKLMEGADILVDATNRRDPGQAVVQNAWLDCLPKNAVIVDLAVDPYLLDNEPKVVRGIEGIPQGNLDQYVFAPDDPNWDASVPAAVPSACRRTVVSCYSWPGIHPEACMEHYARQLEPMMEVLLTKPYESINLNGNYFERALARAKLPEN
jgi:alanine dehydrogenase